MDLQALAHRKLDELRSLSFVELTQIADSLDEVILNSPWKKVSVFVLVDLQENGELVVVVKATSAAFAPLFEIQSADGFRIGPNNQIRELDKADLDEL